MFKKFKKCRQSVIVIVIIVLLNGKCITSHCFHDITTNSVRACRVLPFLVWYCYRALLYCWITHSSILPSRAGGGPQQLLAWTPFTRVVGSVMLLFSDRKMNEVGPTMLTKFEVNSSSPQAVVGKRTLSEPPGWGKKVRSSPLPLSLASQPITGLPATKCAVKQLLTWKLKILLWRMRLFQLCSSLTNKKHCWKTRDMCFVCWNTSVTCCTWQDEAVIAGMPNLVMSVNTTFSPSVFLPQAPVKPPSSPLFCSPPSMTIVILPIHLSRHLLPSKA